MEWKNKKMWIGIVSGVILTACGLGYATQGSAQSVNDQQPPHRMNQRHGQKPPTMEPEKIAKHMAEQFGIEESDILSALNEKKDFRDIGHAAMLAKVSGKSFNEILSAKTDDKNWRDVEQSLGITHEQIKNTMDSMMADRIAESGKMDKATAKKLLDNGYMPHDIVSAGKLANASGKDVQTILDKKKINNRWQDVAKELGVNADILRPARGEHPFGGPGMGGPMGGPMHGPMGGPGNEPPTEEPTE